MPVTYEPEMVVDDDACDAVSCCCTVGSTSPSNGSDVPFGCVSVEEEDEAATATGVVVDPLDVCVLVEAVAVNVVFATRYVALLCVVSTNDEAPKHCGASMMHSTMIIPNARSDVWRELFCPFAAMGELA